MTADGGPPVPPAHTAAGPTLEDGWRTLADGMNVHRWFHSSHRVWEELLRRRYETVGARQPLPPLAELRRRWSRGALLQLLHPAQDAGDAVAVLRAGGPARGAPLVVPDGGRLTAGGELCVLPAQLAAAVPAVSVPLLRQAWALVAAAGLGPLCRVAVDVVAIQPVAFDRTAARHAGAGCALVRAGAGAVESAVQIATAAALQLLAGLEARYAAADHGTQQLRSPLTGERCRAADLAAEAVAVGTAHRLLSHVGRQDGAADDVARLAPVVYDLEGLLELTCFEYVTDTFPAHRRYEKYERGYGMGQQ